MNFQFYTDPVSGYVFRSKKDALRYVQTGEISRHAFRPKKPPSDAPELMKDEISVSLQLTAVIFTYSKPLYFRLGLTT